MKQFLSTWQWAIFFGIPTLCIIIWMMAGENMSHAWAAFFAIVGFGGFFAAFIYLVVKSGRGGNK